MYKADEIKDVSHEIMLSLWNGNKLEQVRNKENINYWLAIICRNESVDYLKSRRKEILIDDTNKFDHLIRHNRSDEMAEVDPGKDIEALYKSLSPNEELMLKLYFIKKLALKDIAHIMHLPLGTVSSAITRMRQKVRNFFKK